MPMQPPRWTRTCTATLLSCLCLSFPGQRAGAVERGVAIPARWPEAHSRGLIEPQTEAFVSQLLARLTLEEKVGQMIQADIGAIKPADLHDYPLGSILAGGGTPPLSGDERAPAQAWIDTARAFRAASLEKRKGHTPIPLLFGIDAVHGNNNVRGATIFPHNIALGATRDPDLVRRIGVATAEEVAATGMDWTFAPTLAVPQDYRWGRTFEGYSSDPKRVAQYAEQMVLGLQGEPGGKGMIQSGHIAATAKHFLADGATTDGKDQGDADIRERDLIDTHVKGYVAAIGAGVMTVMASYSSWQGQKMHGNHGLLTDVLKKRLGFEGFVVGDWNGHAQLPGCSNSNCPAAVLAGVDMYMAADGWRGLYDNLLKQARSGQIPMSRINDAVRRILRVKARLGLFDAARPWEGRVEVLGSKEHRALAREAVRKSLVVLKITNGMLPIHGNAHVLVAGDAADDIGLQSGGWTLSWQGDGNRNSDFPNGQSIFAGLRQALNAAGGSAELSITGAYAQKPDIAVVVFGERPYAEGKGDLRSLVFSEGDPKPLALLKRLRQQGIRTVAVFLSGRPLHVEREMDASDAFVAAWLPGTEGGGVADLLVGDPDGKARHEFVGRPSFEWPRDMPTH